MRVAIIDNPHSYRGPYPVDRIRPILAAAGWVPRVYDRERAVPTAALVARILDDGAGMVVAAGGDGTLRDVAAIMAGSGVTVGLLPGGTANVFARDVGIPGDPHGAALALVEGVDRAIDVGRVTVADGRWGRFVMAAGLGLDGAVLAATPAGLKRKAGPLAIAMGALSVAPTWRARAIRVRVDGLLSWEGQAWQLITGNTRLYANLVMHNPAAVLDDGRLDLCILPAASWLGLARLGLTLALARIPPAEDAVWFAGREIEIEVLGASMPLELDGTAVRGPVGGFIRFSAEPGALVMRLPMGSQRGSGALSPPPSGPLDRSDDALPSVPPAPRKRAAGRRASGARPASQ
ncbi:MAG: diacylglycerol/lipid kinase family protein [Candidatus Limnocylindrales bacterium]